MSSDRAEGVHPGASSKANGRSSRGVPCESFQTSWPMPQRVSLLFRAGDSDGGLGPFCEYDDQDPQ